MKLKKQHGLYNCVYGLYRFKVKQLYIFDFPTLA